jgi:flagellar basal-body rod modification protein FlgD
MSTEGIPASTLRTLEDYQKSVSSSKSKGTNVDANDFMKLFVAQLSNQDPMSGSSGSGSSGTDYITQLAQMTMLEQLSSLNTSLSTSQAYSMIGKYAYIGSDSSSSLMLGKVAGVINEDGVYKLMINGDTYDLSEVCAVVDDGAISPVSDDEVLASANLIGKTVTASVTEKDADGKETTSTVTGKVDKILVKEGAIYLVIGNQNIALSDVTEIAEAAADTTTV